MTVLTWDQVGDRRFETGIERGILFLPEGGAVPWNGLVSLTENLSSDVKSYYVDGVKYLEHQVLGTFSGTLQAFTYPDEFDALIGVRAFAPGVFVHNQRAKTFSLCYRTKVGNDVEGVDYGYKIHFLYDVLASPGNNEASSIKETVTPQLFEWALSSIPSIGEGIRPTSHISLNSQSLDPELLEIIETLIYGTDEEDAALPSFTELLTLVEEFYE